MKTNDKITQIFDAIAALNPRFPSNVTGRGIEKKVKLILHIDGGEFEHLYYSVFGTWDKKYDIKGAIENEIRHKAADLGIPVCSSSMPF